MISVPGLLILLLLAQAALVLVGHFFRLLRWEQFIRIYERPARMGLLRGMTLGYALNFLLPFHVGDLVRAAYTGRRMKNGFGFALATVLMDRFLDVWFVALFFGYFVMAGTVSPTWSLALEAAKYYFVFSLVLALVLVLILLLQDSIKRICRAVCGIFNEHIELEGLEFCWSLIHTFKDLRRVDFKALLRNTLFMWAAYLGSYSLLAYTVRWIGHLIGEATAFTVVDVFNMLFGLRSVTVTSFAVANGTALSPLARGLFVAWFLLPLAVMWGITLLPEGVRLNLNKAAQPEAAGEQHRNLLPQADPGDRRAFLSKYFGNENKNTVSRFLEMNQHITILQDYSAGSNATTMLCMDETSTFYRKYAFGEDGKKLAEQLSWLRAHEAALPLCKILRSGEESDCCWYDMTYSAQAVGMFRYLHSNPTEKSAAILRQVLGSLQQNLYAPTARPADPDAIETYLAKKVDANLEKIRDSRILRDLRDYDTVWVNGTAYKNLPRLEHLFDHKRLAALFADDPICDIHGDLTIENIICRTDAQRPEDGWYLIDPNTGNVHDSPFLDFGKLLQSLHGGYEFMMQTPRCSVQGDHIDFTFTRSAAYDTLFREVRSYLEAHYTPRQVESIFLHELIHWLRLMPYKLSKDKKRAAMFYAGLLMVANDIDRWYSEVTDRA